MSQEAKMKISLDDQVSSTARVFGKNIHSVVTDTTSVLTDGIVETLHVSTAVTKKLTEVFGELHNILFEKEKERSEAVAEQLEEQEKTFKDHFESINENFAKFSEQIISGSGELVGSISQFPEAFEQGFSIELNKIVKDSGSSFRRISKLGETTSKNLNESFKTFFATKFKGETASLGDFFKNFSNTMKSNFINSLADMAAAFATSKIFGLLTGGLNILGFSKGGVIPSGEDGPKAVCLFRRHRPGVIDGLFLGRSGEGELILRNPAAQTC